jgi:PPM family protein phosphatase
MRFTVYQTTRQGGREKNEDRMGYSYTRHAGLFALADGMGGHPEGEVAAQLALQTMAGRFQRECKPRLEEPMAFLQEAIVAGHHQLQRYGERRSMNDTPRTTIVACVLQGNLAYWAHCGDSRLYLIRAGRLLARTRDHSYAELQDAQHGMRPERYNRNVLFTCLGSPGLPVIDTAGPHPLQAGDRLLLCSDGLWGNVTDDLITDAMARAEIGVAVPELVEIALRNGGPRCDNVTALAMEWEAAEDENDEAVLVDHPLDAAPDGDRGADTQRDTAFATTIRPTLGALEPAEEIDIDRSIREINDAIRRASPPPKP